jgi:cytoskeletal protein RodZ
MSERDTFGPRLRRERERRGISLETIVTRTNVSLELWQGFESNDLSRWPTRIYARAFVRDYARAVGLDPDEVVDDFCRLFPEGDRRAVPVIRAQAELIGHETTVKDDARLIPDGIDRRANPNAAPPAAPPRRRLVPRILGAIFDTHS